MLNLKNVLVVVEPDQEEQPALDKVLALAHLADFDLTLVSVDYTQYLVEGYYFDAVDLPALRKEFVEERRQKLESIAGPLRENGLTVNTRAHWGHPAFETVIREAKACQADLVVTHTRQHSALSRVFLTNNDWQLVRCCPVPLLLVKEKTWSDTPVVLGAVDPKHARHKPSGLDHRILEAGGELARLLRGELHAAHASAVIPVSSHQVSEAAADHEAAFARLMADFDVPDANRHLSSEAPEFALSQLEQSLGVDIVVMGAISRSLLSEVFIGNTTERVLDFLTCDILVVKPEDFVSPVKD